MQSTQFRRHALLPKPESQDLPLPVFPQQLWGGPLSYLLTGLSPAERRALREIAQEGDLLIIAGQPYLVAPLSQDALDTIAAFEPESEELEPDDEDWDGVDQEKDDADREPDDYDESEDGCPSPALAGVQPTA